jgi:hypothetical protein
MNFVYEIRIDFEAPSPRHVEQPEKQVRTIQDPSPQLRGNGHMSAGHYEIAVHHVGRQCPRRSAIRRHGLATVYKPEQGLMESGRMPIILLHELLHPQEVRPILKSVQGSDPNLFIERQNFLRHPGFNV